jgi:hypothetical protein
MVEFEAAMALQPYNDQLRMDLEKARVLAETSVEADELQ